MFFEVILLFVCWNRLENRSTKIKIMNSISFCHGLYKFRDVDFSIKSRALILQIFALSLMYIFV